MTCLYTKGFSSSGPFPATRPLPFLSAALSLGASWGSYQIEGRNIIPPSLSLLAVLSGGVTFSNTAVLFLVKTFLTLSFLLNIVFCLRKVTLSRTLELYPDLCHGKCHQLVFLSCGYIELSRLKGHSLHTHKYSIHGPPSLWEQMGLLPLLIFFF